MSGVMYSVSYRNMQETERFTAAIQEIVINERQRRNESRVILSELEWSQNQLEDFSLPENFDEIQLLPESNEPFEIPDDSVFISALPGEDGLAVTILNHNLPNEKCEQIVSDFARQVYKKAVGEDISQDEISIQPIASLKHPVCQKCHTIITDFSYQCSACQKTFCYTHRRQELHGCSWKRKSSKTSPNKTSKGKKATQGSPYTSPKIIIQKVPCG